MHSPTTHPHPPPTRTTSRTSSPGDVLANGQGRCLEVEEFDTFEILEPFLEGEDLAREILGVVGFFDGIWIVNSVFF